MSLLNFIIIFLYVREWTVCCSAVQVLQFITSRLLVWGGGRNIADLFKLQKGKSTIMWYNHSKIFFPSHQQGRELLLLLDRVLPRFLIENAWGVKVKLFSCLLSVLGSHRHPVSVVWIVGISHPKTVQEFVKWMRERQRLLLAQRFAQLTVQWWISLRTCIVSLGVLWTFHFLESVVQVEASSPWELACFEDWRLVCHHTSHKDKLSYSCMAEEKMGCQHRVCIGSFMGLGARS